MKEYSIITLAVALIIKLFAKIFSQFLGTFQVSEDYSTANSNYINTYLCIRFVYVK